MENQSHICPNPLCGKTFPNPIKAENLCSKNIEHYDACPFCLTEITLENDSMRTEEKTKLDIEKIQTIQAEMFSKKKDVVEPSSNAPKCEHHLGYLSNRAAKEKIPEGCIVCENIVQCMLKNVTG